jgi:NAD-dependent SIR2 family protein deacetylase
LNVWLSFFFGRCDQCYFLEIRPPAVFFGRCDRCYFLEIRQQAISSGQMLPDSFFVIPPAGHFLWTNAPRFLFCNPVSRPFSLDKCSKIHFLQFRQQAVFPGQMLQDSFFAIPPAGRFPWTNAPRFIFCNSASRPFSLDKCSKIHFLQFRQQAIFYGQMHPDSFFVIPSAGHFLWTVRRDLLFL